MELELKGFLGELNIWLVSFNHPNNNKDNKGKARVRLRVKCNASKKPAKRCERTLLVGETNENGANFSKYSTQLTYIAHREQVNDDGCSCPRKWAQMSAAKLAIFFPTEPLSVCQWIDNVFLPFLHHKNLKYRFFSRSQWAHIYSVHQIEHRSHRRSAQRRRAAPRNSFQL